MSHAETKETIKHTLKFISLLVVPKRNIFKQTNLFDLIVAHIHSNSGVNTRATASRQVCSNKYGNKYYTQNKQDSYVHNQEFQIRLNDPFRSTYLLNETHKQCHVFTEVRSYHSSNQLLSMMSQQRRR